MLEPSCCDAVEFRCLPGSLQGLLIPGCQEAAEEDQLVDQQSEEKVDLARVGKQKAVQVLEGRVVGLVQLKDIGMKKMISLRKNVL